MACSDCATLIYPSIVPVMGVCNSIAVLIQLSRIHFFHSSRRCLLSEHSSLPTMEVDSSHFSMISLLPSATKASVRSDENCKSCCDRKAGVSHPHDQSQFNISVPASEAPVRSRRIFAVYDAEARRNISRQCRAFSTLPRPPATCLRKCATALSVVDMNPGIPFLARFGRLLAVSCFFGANNGFVRILSMCCEAETATVSFRGRAALDSPSSFSRRGG